MTRTEPKPSRKYTPCCHSETAEMAQYKQDWTIKGQTFHVWDCLNCGAMMKQATSKKG